MHLHCLILGMYKIYYYSCQCLCVYQNYTPITNICWVFYIYIHGFFHLCNLFLLINQNLVFPLQFSTYSRLINTAYATPCDIFSFFPLIFPFLITFFRRDDHFWFTQEGLHHICRLASILKL